MSTPEPEVATPCGCILGESATWSAREQALYWVDIRAPALHRLEPGSGQHRWWQMPQLCTAVVPAPSGVVVALRCTLAHFDPITGTSTHLAEIEPAADANRLNEAKCDRAGRLWIGSMTDFGAAVTGSLYVVGPNLVPQPVLTGIRVPNSLGWSPNGDKMYFADTADRTLRRYAYDIASGMLGPRSVLAHADAIPGRPDGCTVDAEGFVWSTRFGAGQVVRIAPDGRVAASLSLPTSQPTSCALGGPELRTLFITTARQRLSPAALEQQPLAGHLLRVEVETPGLPDVEFRC